MSEGHDLLHGEAVAWGLGVELAVSAGRSGLESEPGRLLMTLAEAIQRAMPCPAIPPASDVLWPWALMDKKNEGDRVQMVLLSGTAPLKSINPSRSTNSTPHAARFHRPEPLRPNRLGAVP